MISAILRAISFGQQGVANRIYLNKQKTAVGGAAAATTTGPFKFYPLCHLSHATFQANAP